MMKKLTCLGCATLGLLVMSACGSTTPIDFDNSKIWSGGPYATNQVSTQGYWWTYTDHNGYDVTHGAAQYEQGATISPLTNVTTPLALEVDTAAPERGYIIHVWGTVPPSPLYSLVAAANYTDQYWKSVYPDSLIADYPSAGTGFGFQGNNAPYDVVQGKYVGFVFDMKTEGGTNNLAVSVPNVYTALPDPTAQDKFTKKCAYPHQEAGVDDATSYTDTADAQTCSGNYNKIFPIAGQNATAQDGGTFSGDTRAADGVWKTYCVLWSELAPESWIKPAANLPAAITTGWLAQTIQLKWDFFQPGTPPATAASFDVRLDNVKMVTATEASANGVCNPANVSNSATIAGVPAS